MKISEPGNDRRILNIFESMANHSLNPKKEEIFADLAKLVDLKKEIKKLDIKSEKDLDDKNFAETTLNTLLNRVLNQISFIETPSKLSPEAIEKAKINLETKLSQLHELIGKRQQITKEELEKLEVNLFRSYAQIVLNKITDSQVLLNVAMIENAIKTINDLELIK